MRNRVNPWVVIITAALAFGSLMAFVGPRTVGHRSWAYRGYYGQPYGYYHVGCAAPNGPTKPSARPKAQ